MTKATTTRLKVSGCSKGFPGVQALTEVSLTVGAGEIHALLGENGAGKSTLGKIIAGVYHWDAGAIEFDGIALDRLDETSAGALGIGIVHQEGSLVGQLSIAENIFAGRQPIGRFNVVDRREMVRRTRELLNQLGVSLDPWTPVRALSTAQAQIVEIAKALSRDLKLLILDEPTSALTLTETARLFDLVRGLKASGVSIIYVSHRLSEIFELCDRVTVLKDGQVTGRRLLAETNQDELIRLMVGRDVHFARESNLAPGELVLEVNSVAAAPFVRNASFSVRRGEIVCLAGLVGSGRSEVCETIFGTRRHERGEIRLHGTRMRFEGPWDAMAAGVGMVPEDRKTAGLFLAKSLAENITIAVLSKVSPGGVISDRAIASYADRYVKELNIATPDILQLVGNLSGGNQQKVLLAKWLAPEPDLLIVDEPTRGVDVGARAEIYRLLRALRAKGFALLVVSSDLTEVLTLADRIVVMADGRTVGELPGDVADEESVLRLATQHTSIQSAGAA
ncbi:sugar ABC transporter ATP-binding protein [Devosia algicola]|uniref:Sugar ABC transporter ATP-binding protein n=1 Tax=Devosia algicola TaxID=3026418 RepID=A0ABY7YRP5_9HYPH|nr:sugar ABC transporter ATP-binding protein [Devosia algicola]WDR03555.1 sugar ABC transporter ATP-binding protein [Devosia algicola]